MHIALNRVILFVQHVSALTEFYQTHFGFQLTEEIKGEWAVLKTGNCELALHKAGVAYGTNNNNPPGENNNVKLVFETDADLHQLREKLIDGNVAMKEIKFFKAFPFLFCDGADIEGNIFQLVQRTGSK